MAGREEEGQGEGEGEGKGGAGKHWCEYARSVLDLRRVICEAAGGGGLSAACHASAWDQGETVFADNTYIEPSTSVVLLSRPPVHPVPDPCAIHLCFTSVPPVPAGSDASAATAAVRNQTVRTEPDAVASARTTAALTADQLGAGGPSVRRPAIAKPRSRPDAAAARRLQERCY